MSDVTRNTTTTSTANTFKALYETDCSAHIERKGGFSYLSWPFAVAELRKRAPDATWEVKRFGPNEEPFQVTSCGIFVEVAVTVSGITLSQIHPVLDNKNRPIKQPDAFHINTSIQRGLVKAIALHGLGLSIYAGEDVPRIDPEPIPNLTPEMVSDMRQRIQATATDEMQFIAWLGVPSVEAIQQGNMHQHALQALDKKKARMEAEAAKQQEKPAEAKPEPQEAPDEQVKDPASDQTEPEVAAPRGRRRRAQVSDEASAE